MVWSAWGGGLSRAVTCGISDQIEGDELCHSDNGVSLLVGFAMNRVWSARGGGVGVGGVLYSRVAV